MKDVADVSDAEVVQQFHADARVLYIKEIKRDLCSLEVDIKRDLCFRSISKETYVL